MQIYKVEQIDKKKSKIFIEGKEPIVLYKGEIRRLGLTQNSELEYSEYEKIMVEIVQKRAYLRLLHLLDIRDYTEYQLRDKLRKGDYPSEAIDYAINKVIEYGYIDDNRYAYNYIVSCIKTRSAGRIKQDLIRRGINKKYIDLAFEKTSEDGLFQNTSEMIRKILNKRHYYDNEQNSEQRAKQFKYLLGKGFSPSDILKELKLDISM